MKIFLLLAIKIEFLRSLQPDDKNDEVDTSDPFAVAIFEVLKDGRKKHIMGMQLTGIAYKFTRCMLFYQLSENVIALNPTVTTLFKGRKPPSSNGINI